MPSRLHRYWLSFDAPPETLGAVRMGCGVTAFSLDDALALIRQRIFRGGAMPALKEIVGDVDVSGLDPGHIVPNMEEPASRGIWYPCGHRLPEDQL